MKKYSVFLCEKCGRFSDVAAAIATHEERCLPLAVGQQVRFLFGLISREGRITATLPAQKLGARPTVGIKTEKLITDIDFSRGQDGKHVWVDWKDVQSILTEATTAIPAG